MRAARHRACVLRERRGALQLLRLPIISVPKELRHLISFIFTPLSTSALGSLPARLFAHGSAIMGTIRQLGGAVGTAVFVTVMSIGVSHAGFGASTEETLSGGFHDAVFIGAVASFGVLVVAMLPSTPVEERSV